MRGTLSSYALTNSFMCQTLPRYVLYLVKYSPYRVSIDFGRVSKQMIISYNYFIHDDHMPTYSFYCHHFHPRWFSWRSLCCLVSAVYVLVQWHSESWACSCDFEMSLETKNWASSYHLKLIHLSTLLSYEHFSSKFLKQSTHFEREKCPLYLINHAIIMFRLLLIISESYFSSFRITSSNNRFQSDLSNIRLLVFSCSVFIQFIGFLWKNRVILPPSEADCRFFSVSSSWIDGSISSTYQEFNGVCEGRGLH